MSNVTQDLLVCYQLRITSNIQETSNVITNYSSLSKYWNLSTPGIYFYKEEFTPFLVTLPKTLTSRATVEQFHRWSLNCFWHSWTPSLAPFPMLIIRSGLSRQSCRWSFTRPAMLLHMIFAPNAYTWDINLHSINKQTNKRIIQVNILAFISLLCICGLIDHLK